MLHTTSLAADHVYLNWKPVDWPVHGQLAAGDFEHTTLIMCMISLNVTCKLKKILI